MQKIDRLGWVAGLVIAPYGTRLGVRTNDPKTLDRVRKHLLPNWSVSTSGDTEVDHLFSIRIGPPPARPGLRSYHLLYAGLMSFARTLDEDELFATFDQRLHSDIATTANSTTFIHAGVVGWRGKAVLIPGRTRAGKSTLVKALVDRGATFYSDEFAVLDADGRIHAYPRDLSLRRRTGKTLIPAGALGWDKNVPPLTVGAVVMTRFRKGARFAPRRAARGAATLELFTNGLATRFQPQRDLAAIAKAVSSADVLLTGLRGAAGTAAQSIMASLDT